MTLELRDEPRWKRYPAYQDSGEEWIGDIPEGWEVSDLGKVLSPRSQRNRPKLPLLSITREKGVIVRDVEDDTTNHNFIPDDLTNYKVLLSGQFGMNKMKAWQGSYGVSEHDGIVSPAYYVFDVSSALESHFFHLFVRNRNYVAFFAAASDGVRIGQWDLSQSRMKRIPVLIPTKLEQTAIAEFLDEKTAKIEEAIRQKERMIELLKERKQILIQQAVTRGLDPNVPMKDSGIEWIDQIPAHWESDRFKNLFQQSRLAPRASDEMVTAFRDGEVTLRKNRRLTGYTEAIFELGYQGIRSGQLVLNSMDAFEGAIGVSDSDGKCSPEYVICDPVVDHVHPKYFALLLREMALNRYIQVICSAVRQRAVRIRFNNLAVQFLAVPPFVEQEKICSRVDVIVEKTSNALHDLETQIARLREYRATLIDSAVTGKIDVRSESR